MINIFLDLETRKWSLDLETSGGVINTVLTVKNILNSTFMMSHSLLIGEMVIIMYDNVCENSIVTKNTFVQSPFYYENAAESYLGSCISYFIQFRIWIPLHHTTRRKTQPLITLTIYEIDLSP